MEKSWLNITLFVQRIREESRSLEQEINHKVFDLYNLSYEEREYVNSNFR